MQPFSYQCHFHGYVETIEEDATLFWKGDPDPSPETQNEKSNPAQHHDIPPSTERGNSKTLELFAPVLASDINVLRPSTMHVALHQK